jgi:hypothetical protein
MSAPPLSFDEIERILGLKEGFVTRLWEEDDWSFVIKATSLTEAILTEALKQPGLRRPLERLPLGHPEYGKLKFALLVGILPEEDHTLLQLLNTMRNRLAHHVKNVAFQFDLWLSGKFPKLGNVTKTDLRNALEPTFPNRDVMELLQNDPKGTFLWGLTDAWGGLLRVGKDDREAIKVRRSQWLAQVMSVVLAQANRRLLEQ